MEEEEIFKKLGLSPIKQEILRLAWRRNGTIEVDELSRRLKISTRALHYHCNWGPNSLRQKGVGKIFYGKLRVLSPRALKLRREPA